MATLGVSHSLRPYNLAAIFASGPGAGALMYDRPSIAWRVAAELQNGPRLRIAALAALLKMDRHTLTRAVIGIMGTTPRALQRRAAADAIVGYFRSHPTATLKEAAFELGYTPATLARTCADLFQAPPRVVRTRVLGAAGGDACESGRALTMRQSDKKRSSSPSDVP